MPDSLPVSFPQGPSPSPPPREGHHGPSGPLWCLGDSSPRGLWTLLPGLSLLHVLVPCSTPRETSPGTSSRLSLQPLSSSSVQHPRCGVVTALNPPEGPPSLRRSSRFLSVGQPSRPPSLLLSLTCCAPGLLSAQDPPSLPLPRGIGTFRFRTLSPSFTYNVLVTCQLPRKALLTRTEEDGLPGTFSPCI